MASMQKHFCGSIADTVIIQANIAHLRFYAEPKAINSSFEAVMTAVRDKESSEKRELFQTHNNRYISTFPAKCVSEIMSFKSICESNCEFIIKFYLSLSVRKYIYIYQIKMLLKIYY